MLKKNGVVAAAAGLGRDRDTSALLALMSIRRDWTAEAAWGVTPGGRARRREGHARHCLALSI